MEGAARAAKNRMDELFWQAWHVEAFARMKGRDFKAALKRHFGGSPAKAQTPLEMLDALKEFKARGVPMNIRRVN